MGLDSPKVGWSPYKKFIEGTQNRVYLTTELRTCLKSVVFSWRRRGTSRVRVANSQTVLTIWQAAYGPLTYKGEYPYCCQRCYIKGVKNLDGCKSKDAIV